MKGLDILATAGALLMAATPLAVAGAACAEPANAVHIQVGDLDFAKRADVARFDARVVKAAEALCDRDMRELSQRNACIGAVREEAVARLGSSQRQALLTSDGKSDGWRMAAR